MSMSCLRIRPNSRSRGPSYTSPTTTEKGETLSTSFFLRAGFACSSFEEADCCCAFCSGARSSVIALSPNIAYLPAAGALLRSPLPWSRKPASARASRHRVAAPAPGSRCTAPSAPGSASARAQSTRQPTPCTPGSQSLHCGSLHTPSPSSPGWRRPCADPPPGTCPDRRDQYAAHAPDRSPSAVASVGSPVPDQSAEWCCCSSSTSCAHRCRAASATASTAPAAPAESAVRRESDPDEHFRPPETL